LDSFIEGRRRYRYPGFSPGSQLKCRHIGAFRDLDPYGVLPTYGQIVALQSPAQPAALNPHDGVFGRIKVGFPPKNLGGHGVALNFLGAAGQGFSHHKTEKVAQHR
jgi:hypothetical protein